ncbi:MAG TPA: radical SAM protein [Smithellaceae bacterium]|nr:radical SAM protein [Smithellaceae bacterium]
MNWKLKKKYASLGDEEKGRIKKVWGAHYAAVLAYPNYYRIGMTNLGFQSVYKIFNDQPSFLCERVFLPEPGEKAEFTGPAELLSLENQKPVNEFAILAFSLSFENDYPHVLELLELAGIPLLSAERDIRQPLVIGGGIAATLNPEPLADFFDLFILGEAEESLPIFTRIYEDACRASLGRRDMLIRTQKELPQAYVPSLYKIKYTAESRIEKIGAVLPGLPRKIKINPIKNINAFSTGEVISAPRTEMADMYLLEVNRGCPRRCRFCAAGFVYQPARFRSYEQIAASVDRGLQIKKKIGLVGTAVSDHPELKKICEYILTKNGRAGIGSLRVDQIDENISGLLRANGIETVALAPEAGSQRLRDLLRKGISEDDIMRAAELLIENEIHNLRLYFMIGLPSEEEEDIDAIINLARKIQHNALQHSHGKRKFRSITLSINQFIPKPATPLQWCALADVNSVGKKIRKIVAAFGREKQFRVIHDVPKWNYVQALLSLGDRRVGEILLAVHNLQGNWSQALKEVNVNADFYVYREKKLDEILPWDIIKTEVAKEKLVKEYQKVHKEISLSFKPTL